MRQGGWNEFNDLRQEAVYLANKWKLDHILPEWIKRGSRGATEETHPAAPYYTRR